MTFAQILKTPARMVRAYPWAVGLTLLVIALAAVYPSDMDGYYSQSKGGQDMVLVTGTEDYGRFINTGLQVLVPVLARDVVGLKQVAVITVVGILATHGPKRLLDRIEIAGTRLGQRPYSPDSRHNMPSGHAALAASSVWFLMRRYSLWFGVITIPVTLLTMYTRVMLDAHTISAVIAGALVGLLFTALLTTRRDAR
jgi:membrane-associated phospholipid phosphatase